jgi:hypothetical protein
MKQLTHAVRNTAAALAVMTFLSGPAFAQTGSSGQGTTGTTATRADDRNDRDYGWIGLLGLIGLAGLMRRNRDSTVDRSDPTRNRTVTH